MIAPFHVSFIHSATEWSSYCDFCLLQVYYHLIGTAQSEDVLVFETPDQPKWMFGVEVSRHNTQRQRQRQRQTQAQRDKETEIEIESETETVDRR